MTLFSNSEQEFIQREVGSMSSNILITFRNKYGPTKLQKLWMKLMEEIGRPGKCTSWWTSAGTVGLLECEIEGEWNIYGQWVLDDEIKLLGVFEVSDDELLDIRDGFDSGTVISSAMRALRIGETGGEKE
ncbi:MAG: hypothetical protein ACXACE_04485 [Candidatus Thorarchaeota archaeon]|jgi:hypothetical protein